MQTHVLSLITGNYFWINVGQALLLLVRRFRLWWDPHHEDSSLLHILRSSHDEGKQFAALVSRLRNEKHT